jgi:hypothetical protein
MTADSQNKSLHAQRFIEKQKFIENGGGEIDPDLPIERDS